MLCMSMQSMQTCINCNVFNAMHIDAVQANCNDHFHTYLYMWNLQNLWKLLTITTFLVGQYFFHYVLSLFLIWMQSIQKNIDT